MVRKAKKRSTSSMFLIRDCSVFECALESERIVEVLVKFYNVIIKCNHYLRRWLKFVDVMLEKVKGPRLKKLRMLQIIEADLQLVIRTILGSRMNERVESHARLSKYYYGSRKGCSIENELLEKRLTLYHAKKRKN